MEYMNKELKKFNSFLMNKNVALIGLGASNLPLIDYLYNLNAKITVFDKRGISEIEDGIMEKLIMRKVQLSLGSGYMSNLKGFDVIFRSPSCRPDTKELIEEENRGALVTSEIELVLKLAPCKIIGITGSDGKTTTTSLIYEILKQKGYKCYLGGNIGIPLFTKIEEMRPEDYVVLELSSFQLMDMKISPNISVITNITPNHLDIHKSYDEYIDSKKNIFKFQNEDDTLVINHEDEITRKFAIEAKGKVIFFSKNNNIDNGFMLDGDYIVNANTGERILNGKETLLRGRHNYENICTALSATRDLVDIDTAISAIKSFKGVEHRIEFVREIDGVKWYNDSIGSSPTRTIAGLKSFEENIVLIAGGYDKHLDYEPLATPIIEKVGSLILFGQTSGKIYDAVMAKEGHERVKIYRVENINEAINKAREISNKGDVVLFSPASASFDMFKNFMERGKKFKELVNSL